MIYLLGGSGYVGRIYQRFLSGKQLSHKVIKRCEIDYTCTATLLKYLKQDRPVFVINAAGYAGIPNVDACERDKANCLFGNAVLPGRIAEACAEAGIPWGHVSSGCIYNGTRADGSGFTEDDPPNFCFGSSNYSFYSGTKALGEEVLRDAADTYIWRLRIPFNHEDGPRNYLSKVMRYDRLLNATNSISQIDEFAAATFACWEKRIPFGIYNVTNPGEVTTREVVELIRESGLCDKAFDFFQDESEFMQTAAITPRSNCVLSSKKLVSAGIQLTPVHDAIRQSLASWLPTA